MNNSELVRCMSLYAILIFPIILILQLLISVYFKNWITQKKVGWVIVNFV